MKTHELKTVQPYFQDVWCGKKPFECRLNDRGFNVGDELILQEFLPEKQGRSGKYIKCEVYYILKEFEGLADDYIIMSIVKTSTGYSAKYNDFLKTESKAEFMQKLREVSEAAHD